MVHEFTKTDWKKAGNQLIIEIPLENPTDKPIVQVYMRDNQSARIITTDIIITDKITLPSNVSFDGYAVVK